MTLDRERATQIVQEAIGKIPALRAGTPFEPKHVAFVQTTGMQLARIFGADSPICKNFSAIKYQSGGSVLTTAFTYHEDLARRAMGGYQSGLNMADGILTSALDLLAQPDADEILRASRVRAEGASVFITHGKESPALMKVERFIRSLGLTPVVVMREASKGMAVDDLVNERMTECDCAIILATADDLVGDKYQPRPNVMHEIGLAQEKLSQKIIYLKEETANFPSNVQPKVWQDFTQADMSPALDKIAKELRAFGLL